MDKAEEIFAEGIEDRNVKTIRQARVLFVICLMAGMFIIFESDDIFKSVSYTHLRAHETDSYLVCRLLLEKKK